MTDQCDAVATNRHADNSTATDLPGVNLTLRPPRGHPAAATDLPDADLLAMVVCLDPSASHLRCFAQDDAAATDLPEASRRCPDAAASQQPTCG